MKENNWYDDYDLFKSFYTHEVQIINKNNSKQILYFNLPKVSDFLINDNYIIATELFNIPLQEIQNNFKLWKIDCYYDFFILIFFVMKEIKDFEKHRKAIIDLFNLIFPTKKNNIKYSYVNDHLGLYINDIFVDRELWDYIWYLIWVSFDDAKVNNKPKIFTSKQEEQFFLKQQLLDEKIHGIKQQTKTNNEKDYFLKIFITISYAMPQLDFKFLFNCTYGQINWLRQYSLNICNYDIEKQALVLGHLKKKLKFFTEK